MSANSSSSEYEKDSQSAIAPIFVYYKEQFNEFVDNNYSFICYRINIKGKLNTHTLT